MSSENKVMTERLQKKTFHLMQRTILIKKGSVLVLEDEEVEW